MPLSKILSGSLASGVGGKVLQVVQTVKTDTFSLSSSTFTDVTGLSVSITPSSSSNKILVLTQISYGGEPNMYAYARLIRGSTSIFQGDSDGASRMEATVSMSTTNDSNSEGSKQYMCNITYLDSPATTSSTTYKIQIASPDARQSVINRSQVDSNNDYQVRSTSSITVMEIAA